MNPVFRLAGLVLAAALLAPLAACGSLEWPPPGQGRGGGRTSSFSGSAAPFIAANAVRVGPGDTLYAIARRHRVILRALIEANHLEPPYTVRVGQRLVLPRGREHTVAAGDTLYSLANRYGVDVYQFARINGLKPPYLIRVGERLLVPEEDRQTARAAAPRLDERKAARTPRAVTKAPLPAPTAASAGGSLTPPRRPSAPRTGAPGKGFVWPVRGPILAKFGTQSEGLRNDGINIAVPRGTAVRATDGGTVAYVGNELRGFGNLVLIKHDGGWVSAYAHADRLFVRKGQRVARGQKIATVGDTGGVARPQLHFELRRNKRPVDPMRRLAATS